METNRNEKARINGHYYLSVDLVRTFAFYFL